jgi:hypothetical protein
LITFRAWDVPLAMQSLNLETKATWASASKAVLLRGTLMEVLLYYFQP